MSKSSNHVVTPEERELDKKRVELAALEGELGERELELATLQNELRAFEARYLRMVGALYAELDEIQAQIAEAQAQRHPHDESFNEQARAARSQANASAGAISAIVEGLNERFTPSNDLRALYREIARTIHPDLAIDDHTRARRTRLMAEANAAYASGNLAKLQAILDEWHGSPDAVEGQGIGAELVRTIRKIHQVERRLQQLRAAISDIAQSPLHSLLNDVRAADADGRDLLAEMVEQVRADIAAARSRLGELVSRDAVI